MQSPAAPAGAIELLDRAIRLYRDHFGLALRVVAVLLVPLNVLMAVTLEWTLGPLFPVIQDIGRDVGRVLEAVNAYGGMRLFLASFSVSALYFVLYSFLAPLATGALFVALEARQQGAPMDLAGAYRALKPILGPFLSVVVLKGAVVMMGYVFFVIPGIVLALLWGLAELLVVLERRGALDALGRSQELMRDPSALLRLLGLRVLLLVAGFVGGQIIRYGYVLLAGAAPGSFLTSTLISAIPEILLLPLNVAVLLVFYYDLRVRNEAFDLELEAARLGLDDEGGPRAPVSGQEER